MNYEELKEKILELNKETSADEVKALLNEMAKAELDWLQTSELIRKIARKTVFKDIELRRFLEILEKYD